MTRSTIYLEDDFLQHFTYLVMVHFFNSNFPFKTLLGKVRENPPPLGCLEELTISWRKQPDLIASATRRLLTIKFSSPVNRLFSKVNSVNGKTAKLSMIYFKLEVKLKFSQQCNYFTNVLALYASKTTRNFSLTILRTTLFRFCCGTSSLLKRERQTCNVTSTKLYDIFCILVDTEYQHIAR